MEKLCKHSCSYHPELVNKAIWNKLPQELVELIFAKLPLPQILQLADMSKAWAAMTKTSNFKQACAQTHPKMLGLVVLGFTGWDNSEALGEFWNAVLDVNTNKWITYAVEGFPGWLNLEDEGDPEGYGHSMYAGDGGLVCLVPGKFMANTVPILVCNPLTHEWRALPLAPVGNMEVIMVQMEVDVGSKSYKVTVMVGKHLKRRNILAALQYESSTGKWSRMEAGLVYGSRNSLLERKTQGRVFDCAAETLYDVMGVIQIDQEVISSAVVKDRVVVVHKPAPNALEQKYLVSEFEWQANSACTYGWTVTMVKSTMSALKVLPDNYKVFLFASSNHVLLVGNNCEENYEDLHQVIRLEDRAANRWSITPRMSDTEEGTTRRECLERAFMCELRWDATP